MTRRPAAPRRAHAAAEYERQIIANAANWTAFCQRGPFDRRRVDAPTQEEVLVAGRKLAAEAGKRALIYATDPAGHDTFVGSVDAAGVFVECSH